MMDRANRLYAMLFVSLALNLFFLPVIAGRWFWNSRAERTVEALHPAEVKTITLHETKPVPPPPKPKPIPLKQTVPTKTIPHPQQTATKSKATPSTPHPHVLAQTGNGGGSNTVTQGTGSVGVPTLPSPEPPPPPPPPPPPKPKGETREAIPTAQENPEIPDSLRSQVLKTYVRARFDIAANGTAQVTLLTSSGSPELDQLTLASLRRWQWKPALEEGVPVPSTQRLRIEFEVQ